MKKIITLISFISLVGCNSHNQTVLTYSENIISHTDSIVRSADSVIRVSDSIMKDMKDIYAQDTVSHNTTSYLFTSAMALDDCNNPIWMNEELEYTGGDIPTIKQIIKSFLKANRCHNVVIMGMFQFNNKDDEKYFYSQKGYYRGLDFKDCCGNYISKTYHSIPNLKNVIQKSDTSSLVFLRDSSFVNFNYYLDSSSAYTPIGFNSKSGMINQLRKYIHRPIKHKTIDTTKL